MTIRVIQWATGGVGRAAVSAVVAHPELELVGCWVHSPEKVGRDVGELCGLDPLGILATSDVDQLLALDADCVIYTPVMAAPSEVARILGSGANVVTPLGWFFPGGRDESEIESACAQGRATIHGTGIHPGGVTERLPLVLSALSQSITHVRAEEWSDIRSYDAPDVVGPIMGFGASPQDAASSPMPAFLGDGFGQSIAMVAHELGFAVDGEPRVDHDGGGGNGADRLTYRRDPTRSGGRTGLHVAGDRAGRAGDHGANQLVHGRGPPRSALVLRG